MEKSAMTAMNAIGGLAIGMQLAQIQTDLTAVAAMVVSKVMDCRVSITTSAKRAFMIAARIRVVSTLLVHTAASASMDIKPMETPATISTNATAGLSLAIGMQLAQTQTALTAAAAIMVSELMGSHVLITMSAKRVSIIAMRKQPASTLRARFGVHVSKGTMEMVKSAKVSQFVRCAVFSTT